VAIAVLGTALVIKYGQSGLCNRILSASYIVVLGKMSYSLYLWHWPARVFGQHFGVRSYLVIAAVFLLSAASYQFVEKPTRRMKGAVPWIVVVYSITLALSFAMAYSSGLYNTSAFARPTWWGYYYDLDPKCHLAKDSKQNRFSHFLSMKRHRKLLRTEVLLLAMGHHALLFWETLSA